MIALQQALKGQIPVTPGMDCNQDGVVDNKDKSCIAQQIGNYKNQGQGKGNGTSASGGTTIASTGTSSLYINFVYDETGHLLGEYDQNGNLIEEHIWLNNRPIGVITPSGLHYVQTDQLGTPRAITNASEQLVWEWSSDPFGNGHPNTNPSGIGLFSYNLRFPGQYYDAETGKNYNYFRDYDPSIGRYIEPDPIGVIGLKGSIEQLDKFYILATRGDITDQTPFFILPDLNLYSYTHQNPVNNFDSKGKLSIGAFLIAVPIIVGGAVFLDLYAQRNCEQHCTAPGVCPIKGNTGNPMQDQEHDNWVLGCQAKCAHAFTGLLHGLL